MSSTTASLNYLLAECQRSMCKFYYPCHHQLFFYVCISMIFSDDWTKFTDYRGYEVSDEVIQWFWKCIRGWPPERKSRLLQFATGTSRIPVNGFKDLQGSDGPRRFTIEKSGDPSQLPKSHTCFNRVRVPAPLLCAIGILTFWILQIDLPPYKDYATLEQKLTLAVEETVGFGYVSSAFSSPRAWPLTHLFAFIQTRVIFFSFFLEFPDLQPSYDLLCVFFCNPSIPPPYAMLISLSLTCKFT